MNEKRVSVIKGLRAGDEEKQQPKAECYTNTFLHSLTRSELGGRLKAMKKNEIDKKINTHAQE